jgi:hypothetical protein
VPIVGSNGLFRSNQQTKTISGWMDAQTDAGPGERRITQCKRPQGNQHS